MANKMRFLLILFFTLFYHYSLAQEFNFSNKVDDIVTNVMGKYDIPGISLGIVQGDSIRYIKGYGVKDITTNEKVTENSIFHTASISKLFTAQAIMILIESGRISLDDKIIDLIPNLSYKNKSIENVTVKQLLNHTSGISDIKNYHWEAYNTDTSALRSFVLNHNITISNPPSTQYQYCNLTYEILGLIIETVSTIEFEEYVQQNILVPSNMVNSNFKYFEITDSLKTAPHTKKLGVVKKRKTYPYTREHSPSSTLNASSLDLSNWMLTTMQSIKENEYNIESMLEPSFEKYKGIGLGFQLYNIEGVKAVGHFGGDKGFRSLLMMFPDNNFGLVVLGNCDYDEDYRQEIILPIAQLLLNED